MFFKGLAAFLQVLINVLGTVLGGLVGLLPKSPFHFVSNSQFGDLLAKINYFVPIYEFISILELWIVAVGLYYLYSIVARWLKAID